MPRADDQFSLCPRCHRTDGCLVVGSKRWFRCDAHKVVWYAGPDWAAGQAMLRRQGTDQENRARMAGYQDTDG
jgi:hypothetical protein